MKTAGFIHSWIWTVGQLLDIL